MIDLQIGDYVKVANDRDAVVTKTLNGIVYLLQTSLYLSSSDDWFFHVAYEAGEVSFAAPADARSVSLIGRKGNYDRYFDGYLRQKTAEEREEYNSTWNDCLYLGEDGNRHEVEYVIRLGVDPEESGLEKIPVRLLRCVQPRRETPAPWRPKW